MKKFLLALGVVLMLIGAATLIEPEVKMPSNRREVDVAGQKLIINTRRIVTVPPVLERAGDRDWRWIGFRGRSEKEGPRKREVHAIEMQTGGNHPPLCMEVAVRVIPRRRPAFGPRT